MNSTIFSIISLIVGMILILSGYHFTASELKTIGLVFLVHGFLVHLNNIRRYRTREMRGQIK